MNSLTEAHILYTVAGTMWIFDPELQDGENTLDGII